MFYIIFSHLLQLNQVLEVELEKNLLMKEAEKNVSLIKNDITKAEQENLANVEAYKKVFIQIAGPDHLQYF